MSLMQPIQPPARPEASRLSGRVVGQLAPPEQFLLWALRRRTTDGGATSALLVHGFRLAFGLALLEPALAAFARLCRGLERGGGRDLGLLPLTCPCVSLDEQLVLALVLAPAPAVARALAGALVAADAADELADQATELARLIGRAALTEVETAGTVH
jgi:hypothetical protein